MSLESHLVKVQLEIAEGAAKIGAMKALIESFQPDSRLEDREKNRLRAGIGLILGDIERSMDRAADQLDCANVSVPGDLDQDLRYADRRKQRVSGS